MRGCCTFHLLCKSLCSPKRQRTVRTYTRTLRRDTQCDVKRTRRCKENSGGALPATQQNQPNRQRHSRPGRYSTYEPIYCRLFPARVSLSSANHSSTYTPSCCNTHWKRLARLISPRDWSCLGSTIAQTKERLREKERERKTKNKRERSLPSYTHTHNSKKHCANLTTI